MAEVYDRWMENDSAPYDRWVDWIRSRFDRWGEGRVRKVLDIGCGTGNMLARLQRQGFEVIGVDASAEMLALAAEKAAPGTRLHQARLPAALPGDPGEFEAAIATFDVLNYLSSDADFRATLRHLSSLLGEGGVLIFDLNTRYRLERIYGNYHSGDDFGDFAYVWRNHYDADHRRCRIELSIFVREGDAYTRYTETHEQRWFPDDLIAEGAAEAGFKVVEVSDSYGTGRLGPATQKQTWVLVKQPKP